MLSPHIILIVGLLLFVIGLAGPVALRRNLISTLISIELALLGVNCLFVGLSLHLDDLVGQLFALTVLTIAGAESSIGLALLVVLHRLAGVISPSLLSRLKG